MSTHENGASYARFMARSCVAICVVETSNARVSTFLFASRARTEAPRTRLAHSRVDAAARLRRDVVQQRQRCGLERRLQQHARAWLQAQHECVFTDAQHQHVWTRGEQLHVTQAAAREGVVSQVTRE